MKDLKVKFFKYESEAKRYSKEVVGGKEKIVVIAIPEKGWIFVKEKELENDD